MSEITRLPTQAPVEVIKAPSVQPAPPVGERHAEERKPSQPSMSLDEAVGKLETYVQSMQRNLQFSVDAEAGRTVVKVIDTSTGDLIRQIPEQTALELARRLRTDSDVHLLDALG